MRVEYGVYLWYNVVRHYTGRMAIGRPRDSISAARIWYNSLTNVSHYKFAQKRVRTCDGYHIQ